jgi:hypothetical protein
MHCDSGLYGRTIQMSTGTISEASYGTILCRGGMRLVLVPASRGPSGGTWGSPRCRTILPRQNDSARRVLLSRRMFPASGRRPGGVGGGGQAA